MATQRTSHRVPLYQQAADSLRALIQSGEINEMLPSQDELCDILKVSRPTVREAIRLLERAGLVSSRQGIGTVVNRNRPTLQPGLEELTSTTDLISRNGYVAGTSFFEVRAITATKSSYPAFAGQPVLVIERVRTANDVPVVYSTDVVPERDVNPEEVKEATGNGSLMDWFERHGMTVAYAHTQISAENADRTLALRLGVPKGSAVLLMEEIGYDANDQPIYASHDFYRCDLTHFHVVRKPMWQIG